MTDLIMTFLHSQYFESMVSPDLVAKVAYTTFILGLAWLRHEYKVNKFIGDVTTKLTSHFSSMEKTVSTEMGGIRNELREFKSVVEKDLEKGSRRMDSIEKSQNNLTVRVEKIETLTNNKG